jgi:RecB family exonuclease
VITPRTTRLVRVPDLQAFREAVVSLAVEGAPLDARDRLVVVPTHAAAAHLLRTIEDYALPGRRAVLLPDLVTPSEVVGRLAERILPASRALTDAEREVLLGVAARAARDAGAEPPFRLRAGLVAEMLRFYDALRLNGKDVETFERLTLGMLEPGASYDRGAERLVRQTRFLVAAFREFERRTTDAGLDADALRQVLVTTPAPRPVRHIVVTVADRAFDPYGLWPVQWDLLARLPGLERLDIVVTDTMLAGGLHERFHRVLPGLDEVRASDAEPSRLPALVVDSGEQILHVARDREEEVAGFARRVKHRARTADHASLDRIALVVRQPLPYVYVAREVLRGAGIPCQLFDALPLAAEPYAAAVDLVLSFVGTGFARAAGVELLRSPLFRFTVTEETDDADDRASELRLRDVAALDRALREAGYTGEIDALDRLVVSWRDEGGARRTAAARRAGETLLRLARALTPLRTDAPAAAHLGVLRAFLAAHDRMPAPADPLTPRHLRARGALLGTIETLHDAYERFEPQPVPFDEVAALLRRWIEGQTFAPKDGDAGVHLVDAESARFGAFDVVQIAGLVEGEWPDPPRRNIFYSPSVLRELGWPAEAERIAGARAALADLVRLPAERLIASAFTLEADALVSPSPLVDEIERAGLAAIEEEALTARIFDYEAVTAPPVDAQPFGPFARRWLERRLTLAATDDRYRGYIGSHAAPAHSLSALERYQDCPFKFFSADVLRLQEAAEDESVLTPRARGRFIHEVFQQFFAAWDEGGVGTITVDTLDAARDLFARVAEPLLARLSEADAALERTRLFGSAISLGIVDIVLGLEAARPAAVRERWLEYRLEGAFTLGAGDGRRVALRGVADRIDLLDGQRLRVIDYKSGSAPNPRRALQVPVYALCAQERLAERDGGSWSVDEASYVAFSGRRSLAPVVKAGRDAGETLAAARGRLLTAVDAIGRGEFPPRPHDPMICRYCAYSAVCRKDYVGDD